MKDYRVVILAGGKGVRLRPFTASFPKPLVPLGDKPILDIILRQLLNQGFSKVTLTLGHLSELIRAYISTQKDLTSALQIGFVEERQPTGTAGSLANIAGLSNTFLVMNGDVLTNLNFAELIEAHKKSGASLTIAGHERQEKVDLGVLNVDDKGSLRGYIEKPTHTYQVSMGVYVYEPHVLQLVRPGKYLDFPTLVEKLLEAGEAVHVHQNDAFWLDIGRPEDYARAQEIFETDPGYFGLSDVTLSNGDRQNALSSVHAQPI